MSATRRITVLAMGAVLVATAPRILADEVSFTTRDGIEIVADYYPPPDRTVKAPVVILLHMYRHDRGTWTLLIPHLKREGFAVLALDMRGHGQSKGPADMKMPKRVKDRDPRLFNAMWQDVEAGYRFLSEQEGLDLSRFAIVGASVGCSVALNYMQRDPSVDVVVCLTPGTSYLGTDSVSDIKACGNRPILLTSSEEERAAADALAVLNHGATVKIVPGSKIHGTRMFGKVPELERQIAKYLKSKIGLSSSEPVVAAMAGRLYYTPGSAEAADIPREDLRWFSSAREAESRNLHAGTEKPEENLDSPTKASKFERIRRDKPAEE